MAKNVSLAVNVDDQQFAAFMKNFNDFSNKLKGINTSFQQINATIQNTQKQSNALLNTFKAMYQVSNAMLRPIAKITGHFLKWGTIISGITALLGMGGGLFGIERLANSIMQKRRQAMGLGGTYGGTQAALLHGQTFLNNPGAVLQNIALGQAGQAEQQIPLIAMGERFGTKDSPEIVMGRILKRIPDLLKNVRPGTELAVLQGYGLDKIFTIEDLVRMTTKEGREEMKIRLEQIERDKKDLDISKQAQDAWTNFNRQLAIAGAHIQKVLGEGLAKLAEPLSHLSDAFVNLIQTLMDTGIVKDIINQLAQWIEQFASYLKSDQLQKDLKQFSDDIENKWIPMLMEMANNLKEFGNVLGNIVNVLQKIWGWVKWLDDKERGVQRWGQRLRGEQPGAGSGLADQLGAGSIGGGGTDIPAPRQFQSLPGSSSSNITVPPAESAARALAKTSPVFQANQTNVGTSTGGASSYSTPNFSLGGFGGGMSSLSSMNQRFGGFSNNPIRFASNATSSFNQRFAAASSAGGFSGGTSVNSASNTNQFAAAAAGRVPRERGGNFGLGINSMTNVANLQGRGRGPLSTDNWQMSRTAKLEIRNVPGSNVFMSGSGMAMA